MDKSVTHSKIRVGKFKKRLIPEQNLPQEALVMEEKIRPILSEYTQQKISQATLVALTILEYLKLRHPYHWQGSKLSPPLVSTNTESWEEIFSTRALRSVPLSVNRTLLSWKMGLYPLELFFDIPKPHTVLKLQKEGKRCVTMFTKKTQMDHYILGERDSLGFILHDLIHADHFFHENQMKIGQIGFYRQMHELMEKKLLEFKTAETIDRFDYLISDMNSHPVHLWKGFKSLIDASHFEFQSLMGHLKIDESIKNALIKLNREENIYDAQKITDWCEAYGQ
jgi:hypothetical protein